MMLVISMDVPDHEAEAIMHQLEHQIYGSDELTTVELSQGISFTGILVNYTRGGDYAAVPSM